VTVEVRFNVLTPELNHGFIAHAAELTRQIALLNRNHDRFGDQHVPVGLITDDLHEVYSFRSTITPQANPTDYADRFVGTCWTGDRYHGTTAIWLNPYTAFGARRSRRLLVETFSHELAHAFTRGGHGFTFRRMYALVSPHVYATFGERHEWDDVSDIVHRYSIKNRTGRCDEYLAHRIASQRMMNRLARRRVVL